MQRNTGHKSPHLTDYQPRSPFARQHGSPGDFMNSERVVLRDVNNVNNEQDHHAVALQKANHKPMATPGTSPLIGHNKRRTAAQFVEAMIGDTLSCTSDRDFRGALRSGVTLCRLMRRIDPQCDVQVVEAVRGNFVAYQTNVNNFLAWVSAMQAPTTAIFSPDELFSEGYEDTPRIAECLCWIKAMHQAEGMERRASLSASSSGGTPRHGDRYTPQQTGSALSTQSSFSAASARSGGGAAHASPSAAIQSASRNGNQARIGVTKLMQQCTQLLKDKMVQAASQSRNDVSDSSKQEEMVQNFMGPVMEKLLGSLTQEYEKRLHRKENEVTAMEDRLERLKAQNEELLREIEALKVQLEARAAEAERQAGEAAAVQLEELEREHREVVGQLRERQAEVRALEAQVREAHSFGKERFQVLEAAFQENKQRVEYLAGLEANYKTMQEENRKLYNMVQDLKGSIRVFCRIRPMGRTGDASSGCVDMGVDGELAIYDPVKGDRKQFKFDKIFDQESSQMDVYDDVEPLVRSVLDGYNVCIFAYGQTGSGKTHTMSGTNVHQEAGRGINYRALDDLFALRDDRSDEVDYNIRVQMLEIYNESLRDLLVDPSPPAAAPKGSRNLDILNTQASGCNVPGACQTDVTTSEDVLDIMSRGARNRAVGATCLNDRSSRSHQILTVIVDGTNTVTGARSHGCLHLVDLAGSERVAKSEATGDRLLEAQHINKSLSALGDVMSALASKSGHVPFRNSKLTQLLQDSLSGQAKVMMFMHIAPESNSFGETLSTLKFGMRVSEITLGQAKKNVESGKVFEAHEQLTRLQQTTERQQQQIRALQGDLEAARARGSSTSAAQEGLLRQLEDLRFEGQERALEAEEANRKLAEATARIGELTSQMAVYKAQALTGPSRRPSALHSRESQYSVDSEQEPTTLAPRMDRLELDLPHASTAPAGWASHSPLNLSPRATTPTDVPLTPRGAARRAPQPSATRHKDRLQTARVPTPPLTRAPTPSFGSASSIPSSSSTSSIPDRPHSTRSTGTFTRTTTPASRPSLGGAVSRPPTTKPSLSRPSLGTTQKPSRLDPTPSSRIPPTLSARPTSAERATRRQSGGWK